MGPRVTGPARVMMYAELKRTCKRCNETKPMTAFYAKNLHKEGRCRSCVSALRASAYAADPDKVIRRVARYRTDNPEKIRDTKLRQAYGVGSAWFERKLAEQDNGCAGCGKPETTIWRGRTLSLAVDHDHLTGEPRGLLCMRCNRTLGLLEDNKQTLKNLLDYIGKLKK